LRERIYLRRWKEIKKDTNNVLRSYKLASMIILAIETSCDETSVALVEGNEKTKEVKILSNIVSSQVKIHAKWGGVVPSLAAREHLKNIIPVLKKALLESKKTLHTIDLFAVTQGPGLIPALLIGTNFAKTLSYIHKKPLLGIHHIEGHIAAAFSNGISSFQFPVSKKFPLLALVVSGGHTQLILMKQSLHYEIIGQTQDDAAGEAFDKVAKILALGYPGGPIISKCAEKYESQLNDQRSVIDDLHFPRPMINSNDFNFSFSGLKTSVLYYWQKRDKSLPASLHKQAVCKAFQDSAVDVLTVKTIKAAKKYQPKTIILAGGVAANKKLRETLKEKISNSFQNTQFFVPPFALCGDNAAMIGTAAYQRYLKHKKFGQLTELANSWKELEADANLKLTSI